MDSQAALSIVLLLQCVAVTQPFALQGPSSRDAGWPAGASSRCEGRNAQCRLASQGLLPLPSYRPSTHVRESPQADVHEYLKLARRHTKKATGKADELGELQELLGSKFSNRAVLVQAVTHRSAAPKSLDSNQRLEYLGDAVLGMVVAEHLFLTFPQFDEGQLSTIRKELVSACALAKVARREGLGRFARLNAGEEATGGRNKEALLADLVEALIAAVYVDRGIDGARTLVLRWLGNDIQQAALDPAGSDYKSKLQEHLRRISVHGPSYHLVENGPKHNQKFTAHTLVADKRLGWGVGTTKKAAEQAAAKYSLQLLEEKEPLDLERWCASLVQPPPANSN